MAKVALNLDDLPELMDVAEIAELIQCHPETVRRAIKRGELRGFIPRGREPLRAGRGHGYRVTRDDLAAWYLNES